MVMMSDSLKTFFNCLDAVGLDRIGTRVAVLDDLIVVPEKAAFCLLDGYLDVVGVGALQVGKAAIFRLITVVLDLNASVYISLA